MHQDRVCTSMYLHGRVRSRSPVVCGERPTTIVSSRMSALPSAVYRSLHRERDLGYLVLAVKFCVGLDVYFFV